MIEVYYFDTKDVTKTSFNKFYNLISKNRKNKTDNYKLDKDKILSVFSEILLSYALKKNGLEFNLDNIITNSKGKPYLNNDIEFNISHSGTYVMCAISNAEIGCDIEKCDYTKKDITKIAKRFFNNIENEYIINQNSEFEEYDMFFRLWTIKESFIKNTGYGLSLPLSDFYVTFDNDCTYINQNINNQKYYIYESSLINEYKASICTTINEVPKEYLIKIEDIIKAVSK